MLGSESKETLSQQRVSGQLSRVCPCGRLEGWGGWPTFLTRCFGVPALSTWMSSSLFSFVWFFRGWPTKPHLSEFWPHGAETLPVCGEPPTNSLLFWFLKNVSSSSMSLNKCGQVWIYTERRQLQPWCVPPDLLLKCSPESGRVLIKDLNLNVTKYRDTVYSSVTLLVICENVA